MENIVRVGVGVIVVKDKKILLGERIGSHGSNTWSLPGGHMEFFEEINETAKREVKEETSLNICNIQTVGFTNDIFMDETKHYITLFVKADYESGVLRRMEPDKCLEWKWFDTDNLPQPLFLPLQNFINENPEFKI